MIIDLNKYRSIAPIVASVAQNNSQKDEREIVSLISVASGAPVIASAYYYAAYSGAISTQIRLQIDSTVKFYGYTKILGLEEVLGVENAKQEMLYLQGRKEE